MGIKYVIVGDFTTHYWVVPPVLKPLPFSSIENLGTIYRHMENGVNLIGAFPTRLTSQTDYVGKDARSIVRVLGVGNLRFRAIEAVEPFYIHICSYRFPYIPYPHYSLKGSSGRGWLNPEIYNLEPCALIDMVCVNLALRKISLFFGRNSQFVCVVSASPHFRQLIFHHTPLKATENCSQDSYPNRNASPADSRPFKGGHALLNILELLCGGWFCWRGVYLLGFLGRRGWWGLGLTILGFLLLVHGGFNLVTSLAQNVSQKPLDAAGVRVGRLSAWVSGQITFTPRFCSAGMYLDGLSRLSSRWEESCRSLTNT